MIEDMADNPNIPTPRTLFGGRAFDEAAAERASSKKTYMPSAEAVLDFETQALAGMGGPSEAARISVHALRRIRQLEVRWGAMSDDMAALCTRLGYPQETEEPWWLWLTKYIEKRWLEPIPTPVERDTMDPPEGREGPLHENKAELKDYATVTRESVPRECEYRGPLTPGDDVTKRAGAVGAYGAMPGMDVEPRCVCPGSGFYPASSPCPGSKCSGDCGGKNRYHASPVYPSLCVECRAGLSHA